MQTIIRHCQMRAVSVVFLLALLCLGKAQADWKASLPEVEVIGPGVVQLVDQPARRLQFVVMQDGIQGDEHPRMVLVGKGHQCGNVGDAVGRVVPRTEAGPADIHRIGAMQDGLAGNPGITRRAEQFDMVGRQGHGGNRWQAKGGL